MKILDIQFECSASNTGNLSRIWTIVFDSGVFAYFWWFFLLFSSVIRKANNGRMSPVMGKSVKDYEEVRKHFFLCIVDVKERWL